MVVICGLKFTFRDSSSGSMNRRNSFSGSSILDNLKMKKRREIYTLNQIDVPKKRVS